MREDVKAKIEAEAARKIAGSVPRTNVLRFSLVRQVLWGEVGGRPFGPVSAKSGAGQTGVGKQTVKYRDWMPSKKAKGATRGGALVPGWWIVLPEKLAQKGAQSPHVKWGAAPTGNSLRIVPYRLDGGYEGSIRNSFYIHGTGGKGSDGCILIDPAHREVLVELVAGNHGAWLQAYISGTELNEALERSDRFNQTA